LKGAEKWQMEKLKKTKGSPIKGLVKRKNTPLDQKKSLFD
jgi:hypothetical protein